MKITHNQSLLAYNTFGIDVKASTLLEVNNIDAFQKHLQSNQLDTNRFVVGGGSNILFTKDFEGTLLLNRLQGIEIVEESSEEVVLKIGGGVVWHDLVLWTVNKGWSGLENLSLIPGTCGAAPVQNIGAYGVELQDTFVSLEAIDLETGQSVSFDKKGCEFDYRWSAFKGKYKGQFLITSINLRLQKNPSELNISYGAIEAELGKRNIENPSVRDISEVVTLIRQFKLPDPNTIGNAGSFFKNPIIDNSDFKKLQALHATVPSYVVNDKQTKVPAGWLIDQAGWKGKVIGNTGTYKNQALVLVNHGDATGSEIWALAQAIQKDVFVKYGVKLEAEVNVL